MDDQLVEYTAFLCAVIRPEKIIFLHAQHDSDLPDSVLEAYPVLREPLDEQIRRQMADTIRTHFPGYEAFDISYEVVGGSPRKEILQQVEAHQADLLIVGRKSSRHGSGITPRQLARKIGCSLLFVPEKAQANIRHILVATDFSAYSQEVLAQTQAIAAKIPGAAIRCLHVYSLPHGYYKTGLTEPEFAAVMRSDAEKAYEHLLHSAIQDSTETLAPVFIYNPDRKSPAAAIHREAHRLGADLIVAGAQGLSAAAAFLLGSVSANLIQLDHDIPLLIVQHEH